MIWRTFVSFYSKPLYGDLHFGVRFPELVANLGYIPFCGSKWPRCSSNTSCHLGEAPCYGGDREFVLLKIMPFLQKDQC